MTQPLPAGIRAGSRGVPVGKAAGGSSEDRPGNSSYPILKLTPTVIIR